MVKTKTTVQHADMPDVSATLEGTLIGTNGHRATSHGARVAQETGAQPLDENSVRDRAYSLYCQRGCVQGFDVDDWCQAERELRSRVPSV
jgi:hypothetical protein